MNYINRISKVHELLEMDLNLTDNESQAYELIFNSGLTDKELAEFTGLSRSLIWKYHTDPAEFSQAKASTMRLLALSYQGLVKQIKSLNVND